MPQEILRWLGYATIVYFVVMQAYLVVLALASGAALRRNHHLRRFGRVGEMLSSRTTPPVSIVIPAYNEEAGIVDAVRSMSIVKYPRFEIVVTNDGSKDETLRSLIDAFHLEKVRIPYRPDLDSMPLRAIYRGRAGVDITVIDKENGGRADALNAGINAARHPYVMCTDADVVLDPECLVNSMQRVVEDRDRTVGVGGKRTTPQREPGRAGPSHRGQRPSPPHPPDADPRVREDISRQPAGLVVDERPSQRFRRFRDMEAIGVDRRRWIHSGSPG